MIQQRKSESEITKSTLVKSFFAHYPAKTYQHDKILIEPNNSSDFIYFVESGKVKKYNLNYRGDKIILTMFRPGSFLPIADAFNQDLKNCFYYSPEGEAVLRVAPKQEVYDFLTKNPEVVFDSLRRINRRLIEFQNRSLSLMAGNASSSVAYEIYVEASRFGSEDDKKGSISINLTEKGIASRCGLTRETVNREIRKLKDNNLVIVERNGLVVIDLAGIEKRLYKKLHTF